MNDPTLNRPMFQQSPSAASASSSPLMPSMGIGGMTTPDQNAMALRNMFTPQAFRGGGEVVDGVAHFAEGDEVVIPQRRYSGTSPDPSDTRSYRERYGLPALSQFQRDIGSGIDTAVNAVVPDERPATQEQKDLGEGRMKAMSDAIKAQRATMEGVEGARGRVMERTSAAPPKPSYFGSSDSATFDAQTKAREEYDAETLKQAQGNLPPAPPDPVSPEEAAAAKLRAATQEMLKAQVTGRSFADEATDSGIAKMGIAPPISAGMGTGAPPPPPPNKKDEPISTNLETIRSRREASDKQRDENKWMGILAAGLGMMASKSRTAAGGIGEGGLQGLQTFAGLEKNRREDEANLRREDYQQQQLGLQKQQFGLAQEQLAQQKQISMAQLEKDPDTVRLFRALGGGDLQRGLNMYQADGKLQAAKAIMDNYMATPEAKKDAEAYIQNALRRSGEATGSAGSAPPAGSKIIPLNQLGR